jgi:hypothetical protein
MGCSFTSFPNSTERNIMTLEQMTIGDILQEYSPSENDFPLELKEHIANMCNMSLTQEVKWLIDQVYAETKYRVLLEVTNKIKEVTHV